MKDPLQQTQNIFSWVLGSQGSLNKKSHLIQHLKYLSHYFTEAILEGPKMCKGEDGNTQSGFPGRMLSYWEECVAIMKEKHPFKTNLQLRYWIGMSV